MATTLTTEEKRNLVNQAIKSVDYGIYGIELDLLQLNAVSDSDADQILLTEDRIEKLNIKRNALLIELESLIGQL